MTKERYIYRHCSCRNRITSHRRFSSNINSSDTTTDETRIVLVCEECGDVKKTIPPVEDEPEVPDTDT